jgi:hypothetical protein
MVQKFDEVKMAEVESICLTSLRATRKSGKESRGCIARDDGKDRSQDARAAAKNDSKQGFHIQANLSRRRFITRFGSETRRNHANLAQVYGCSTGVSPSKLRYTVHRRVSFWK